MSIFADAVKPDTFLARYLDYNAEMETPLAYDFTAGLWLISAAIGRRVRVERPRAPVWLNLYAILCAEAGTTRKSSAIRRCQEVYDAAGLGEAVLTLTGSITAEGLVKG